MRKNLTSIKLGTGLLAALCLFASPCRTPAQSPVNGGQGEQSVRAAAAAEAAYTRILVTGEATINAQPDTAVINIGVVTQGPTALGAQQANATKTEVVIRAAKQAAGADAEVRTSNYTLEPQYVYRDNEQPRISGYQAGNSVTVTLRDLKRVGPSVDAASQAGANNINSLLFTLRNDQAAREQALQSATRAALAKAKSLAQALGGRFVRIVSVREGGTAVPPIPLARQELTAASTAKTVRTPVEAGTLEIRAEVELIAEVETTAAQ